MRRATVALVLIIAVVAAACSHGTSHPRAAATSSTSSTTSSSSAPTVPATDEAFNVLPPGEYGALPATANSTDQLTLYDGLTPLGGNVTQADIAKYYKPEVFGLNGQVGRPEAVPRPGLTIVRDSWDVPHITGATRADVEFGAGWVTAEDRGLFIEAIRGPARLAAIDAPGVDPFSLATSGAKFVPSPATEQFLDQEQRLIDATGPKGHQVLLDMDAYVAGINAYYQQTHNSAAPWTRNDVLAAAALIGAVFGKGGGDEVGNAEFLARLDAKLGPSEGAAVFRDLRQAEDPEAPTTISQPFSYEPVPTGPTPGAAQIDAGSVNAAPDPPAPAHMSNALLVAASRSATGHPLAVMGPQVGYYYPEFLMEMDLHGGGIDARGAAFPGVSLYVLLGRGSHYAWSATSSDSDVIDQFVEQLCNPDGSPPTRSSTSYIYKGTCTPMTTFAAGTLQSGSSSRAVTFDQTVHGPVSGTVTIGGKPYAITSDRSTRGQDAMSALAFADLNTNSVHSAKDFAPVMNQIGFTFNWFYVDSKDIAYFSSGRLPIRAPGTDPSLPTLGTGAYDWQGFLALAQHPQAIDPPSGMLLNWNNKQAPGWGAADDNWGYGPVFRVQLFTGLKATGNQLADVVSVMNRAATEDLRAVLIWPLIARVLAGGPAPDARTKQAADLVSAWVAHGASRLDTNLTGKIDDPGAAILDASWTALATAVLNPVLGTLTGPGAGTLASLIGPDDAANPGGSSYADGWYGYVDKDLRTLLGDPVQGRYSRVYCGNGDVVACRASLWQALAASVSKLAAAQGADPTAWRSDATKERIVFQPGLLGKAATMRWTNRPTFQQVVSFATPNS
jgi:acyl-homoserine lactone acylase PvdQ